MDPNRKRKPFSDLTNTIPPPIKNPFLTSVFTNLLNDVNGKSIVNSNSISKPGSSFTASENSGKVASDNHSSASVASTPAKTSRVFGTADCHGVVEPSSVYGRRSTGTKRKSEGKQVAVPVAGSAPASIKTARTRSKNKKDADSVECKSSKVHNNKKRKHDEDAQHAMSKKFIEEQNAYFADIDRFELLEEEVESVDQLE